MISLGALLEPLALLFAVLAAIESYRAARIDERPAREDDPASQQRSEHALGTRLAREAADFWSRPHARWAGLWALGAAGMAALACAAEA